MLGTECISWRSRLLAREDWRAYLLQVFETQTPKLPQESYVDDRRVYQAAVEMASASHRWPWRRHLSVCDQRGDVKRCRTPLIKRRRTRVRSDTVEVEEDG